MQEYTNDWLYIAPNKSLTLQYIGHILLLAPQSGKCIMGFYWVIPSPSRNWIHEYRAIYLIKVNNKDTTKKLRMCSELTIKTPERRQ